MNCEVYDAKHESHLLHEEGRLSYDPSAYSPPSSHGRQSRFHIKTMEVSTKPALACLHPTCCTDCESVLVSVMAAAAASTANLLYHLPQNLSQTLGLGTPCSFAALLPHLQMLALL